LQVGEIQLGNDRRGSWPLTTRWAMVSQITRAAIKEVMSLMS
jgi:ribosome maturation protein Sdo1